MRIYTIGHSTRTLDELIGLLKEHDVRRLADIRRYPGSRRYPHFSRESLEKSLPINSIDYVHIPDLGGRRRPSPDSPNTAWHNEQFRGYADHMNTNEFKNALDNSTHKAEIDADDAAGKAAGVSGTPAFFINGYSLSGAQPYPKFRKLIEKALAEAK